MGAKPRRGPIRHPHLAHLRIGGRYRRRTFRRFFLGLLLRPLKLLLLAFGKPLPRLSESATARSAAARSERA